MKAPVPALLLITATALPLLAQDAPPPQRRSVGIAMSIDQDGAIMIEDVIKGSPAEKAGLKPGDQIAMIAGIAAAQLDPAALGGIVDTAKVIPVVVLRGGERLTLNLEPAVMPPGSMPPRQEQRIVTPP